VSWAQPPEAGRRSGETRAGDTVQDEFRETSEDRYFVLTDSLGALLAAAAEDLDDVSRVEIDEIAAVAEELLLEGEAEVAVTLMEGAILLLSKEEEMD
jgi:hypothetical protein